MKIPIKLIPYIFTVTAAAVYVGYWVLWGTPHPGANIRNGIIAASSFAIGFPLFCQWLWWVHKPEGPPKYPPTWAGLKDNIKDTPRTVYNEVKQGLAGLFEMVGVLAELIVGLLWAAVGLAAVLAVIAGLYLLVTTLFPGIGLIGLLLITLFVLIAR